MIPLLNIDPFEETFKGTMSNRVIVLYSSANSVGMTETLRRTVRDLVLVELSPELERIDRDLRIDAADLRALIRDLRASRRAHYWPEARVDPREHRRAPTRPMPVRRVELERRGRSRGPRRGRIVRRYFQRKSACRRAPR